MDNSTIKTYVIFILGSVSAIIATMTSIVKDKYLSGMENLSYRQFLLNSILNEFNSYWLLIIIINVFSILVIVFSIKKIYSLKKHKKCQ